jgi:hypothetical protein
MIVGASNKHERYAYKAMSMLLKHGHEVILVNPNLDKIEAHTVYPSISEARQHVDTVTIYVGASISDSFEKDLLALKPRRIIFNPGAENPRLARILKHNGSETLEACTLVLLQTNQF